MSGIKVSVIMPAYNAERFIAEAIGSVIAQTFCDWELIVIDDCSSDLTQTVAQQYAQKDARIRVIKNAENSGVSVSRMAGIQASRADWVAFLDSDDLWREDKLEKQFAFVQEHPDAQILFTASAFISEKGEPYSYVLQVPETVTYRQLLRGNVMSCSSVLVKRDLMLRYPMEDDRLHEDYASWLQILRDVPCAHGINEPLLIYRLAKGSKSSKRISSAKMVYRTYRALSMNPVESGCNTVLYAGYSILKRWRIRRKNRTDT